MRTLIALLIFISLPAFAETAPFIFDKQLATDLAIAYVKSNSKSRPQLAINSLDYQNPSIISAIDKNQRKFVFVSFSSTTELRGAYVTLELCDSSSQLSINESGVVDNIQNYRQSISKVNSSVYVSAGNACPEQSQ